MPPDYVTVKLDFTNAIKSIRRDLILDAAAANILEIYWFAYVMYLCEQKLFYGPHVFHSKEWTQQGDSLSTLEFCDAVDLILKDLNTEMCSSFMDYNSLSGHISAVAAAEETGFHLNWNKCEMIANDFNIVSLSSKFFSYSGEYSGKTYLFLEHPFSKDRPLIKHWARRSRTVTKRSVISFFYTCMTLLLFLKTPWACQSWSRLCILLNAVVTLVSKSLITLLDMASQESDWRHEWWPMTPNISAS